MSCGSRLPASRPVQPAAPVLPDPHGLAAGARPGPPQAPKGRGTGWRIAHRFERHTREATDDGWDNLDQQVQARVEAAVAMPAVTEVIETSARSALSRNDSPDIPFDLAVNPYRGCEHGCIYCYARPTHSWLNLSPGLDFETRILAKTDIAARLRTELAAKRHRVSPINIGSATDAYQPLERRLGLTRQILQVLVDCGHPYTLVTKSAGVVRDLDLLAVSAARRQVQVFVSVTTLDPAMGRVLEPRAASGARRLDAVRRLQAAGVPVAVNIAPIIPFINEPEIEAIAAAAAAAGACGLHYTVLRLPWELDALFRAWLEQHFPDRAARVLARLRDLHGLQESPTDKVYASRFSQRMRGEGLWADLIRQRVQRAARRHGLGTEGVPLDTTGFTPPTLTGTPVDTAQRELF